MYPAEHRAEAQGITAVLSVQDGLAGLDDTVLDLVAVLDGLVTRNFEILVVEEGSDVAAAEIIEELQVRYPGLPVRLLEQRYPNRAVALAAGFDAAAYDLIFAAAADGQFDVSELNHLLEAIERGADLAIGYRPRRDDGVVRRLQGWGWNVLVNALLGTTGRDVDCAFKLFRRSVWKQLAIQRHGPSATFCAELLIRARRLGFHITEVPVSHHRPEYAIARRAATPTEMGQALTELNELRRDLSLEQTQPARDPVTDVAGSTDRRAA